LRAVLGLGLLLASLHLSHGGLSVAEAEDDESTVLYGDERIDEPLVEFPLDIVIPESTLIPTPTPTRAPPRTLVATVTAYCLTGVMRNGMQTHSGAAATDPTVIPMGTRMRIEGLGGEYRAEDTGSGVRGAHVDVWMARCADALNWGRQTRVVEILGG
jgi:3D (Asp-Asp-Asp) domain-containing protein